jgi:CubicO group peptidase (beta-lactamase class C family)
MGAAKAWCALWLAALAWSAVAADAPPPRTTAELKVQLEQIMREEGVPGMAVAVASEGKIVWQAGMGVANVATATPVSTQTRFRIGEVSQSFVALAALQLQEQGKLRLTDTLKQWAPELAIVNPWEASDPVRLVHLLEHTAGLAGMSLQEYGHNVTPPLTLQQALAFKPEARTARWRPGSRAASSELGPALVAYVIEKVSGQRFEDYVSTHLFLPAGMKSASYFEPSGNFAGQYAVDGVTALPYWNQLYRPSGAVNASLDDMGRYLQLLLNGGSIDGVRVVSPAAVERLARPETLAMVSMGIRVAPGAGMLNTIENNVHFRGHYGIVNGGLSELLYIPDARSGVVLMMNSLNEAARTRILWLMQGYLSQSMGRPSTKPAVNVDPELLQNYAGYYLEDSPVSERMRFVPDLTGVLRVDFSEQGMITRNVLHGYTEEWIAHTGRTFRQPGHAEPMLAMFRAQDGELVMQSKWGTLRRVSAVRALAPLLIGGLSIVLMVSALLLGALRLLRMLARRGQSSGARAVALLPMVASALFVVIAVALAGTQNLASVWEGWGEPGAKTWLALLAGIAFLVVSLASVINVVRRRNAQVGRAAYWHAALVSVASLTVAVYLSYWHAIGVPIWTL